MIQYTANGIRFTLDHHWRPLEEIQPRSETYQHFHEVVSKATSKPKWKTLGFCAKCRDRVTNKANVEKNGKLYHRSCSWQGKVGE